MRNLSYLREFFFFQLLIYLIKLLEIQNRLFLENIYFQSFVINKFQ